MIFNSSIFFVFFSLVFVVYWILQKNLKFQNLFLLVASYFFYAYWDWRFLSLIIYSSLLDFIIGIKIKEEVDEKRRKKLLIISIISNLGILAIFKYLNFFIDSTTILLNTIGLNINVQTLSIILPVGISFYTFQTMSYTIDIYRQKIEPSRDIVSFFTFVSLFPQLVAGPIERASNLLPQINSKRSLNKENINEAIVQILVGLFRKIVVADSLAIYVDTVYGNVDLHNTPTLILATVLYSFQIYFDFAGYSDIAIGSAKLLGFNFNKNFNLPYFSKSMTEFWRRWHISLSTWLRDYLYISLGGNRKGELLTIRNLFLTMLLGGLWHGSSWNFVLWGGFLGAILSIERVLNNMKFLFKIRANYFLGLVITYTLVLISWIFFRSQSWQDTLIIFGSILSPDLGMIFIGNINTLINSILMLGIALLFDIYLFRTNQALENLAGKWGILKISIFCTLIVTFISLFYSTSDNFIYFQF